MKPNLIKKAKAIKTDGRKLTLTEIPETGELEIQKQATVKEPAKMIRFRGLFSILNATRPTT